MWSYVRVCAECECDQKQTSLSLGPFTEYTRRQTAHKHKSSLGLLTTGDRLHREAYPWHPSWGTGVCVACGVCVVYRVCGVHVV